MTPPAPRSASRLAALLAASSVLAATAVGCDSASKTSVSQPPLVTGGPPAAVASNGLGAKWDAYRVGASASYLRGLAGGATWFEVVWCKVEANQGTRDWTSVDRMVDDATRLGFTTLLKIRVGACWATQDAATHVRGAAGTTESRPPKSLDDYASFVRSVVARYERRGVREYAIENEVNGTYFWEGTSAQYAALARVAAAAVHAADPHAVVVDPGVSSTAYGVGIADRLLLLGEDRAAVDAYTRYYARRFAERADDFPRVTSAAQLRAVLDRGLPARDLEYLRVDQELLSSRVFQVRQVHFYERWDSVPDLLGYLHATTPPGVPLEAWEVGQFWRGGPADDRLRASEMVKTVTLLLAAGVKRVIWLPVTVNPSGRHADEPRYGLQAPDGSQRMTGTAMRMLVAAAAGSAVSPVTGRLSGAAFGRGQRTTLVVWAPPAATLTTENKVHATVRDLSGRVSSGATGTVTVTDVPSFVTVPLPRLQALRTIAGGSPQ